MPKSSDRRPLSTAAVFFGQAIFAPALFAPACAAQDFPRGEQIRMLRTAAVDAGIPAVTFELGAPIRLEQKEIDFGVRAVETLMSKLNMRPGLRVWAQPQAVLCRSTWLRTN